MKHLSQHIAKLPRLPRQQESRCVAPLDAREARQILRRHGDDYAHEDVERGLAAARSILKLLSRTDPKLYDQ